MKFSLTYQGTLSTVLHWTADPRQEPVPPFLPVKVTDIDLDQIRPVSTAQTSPRDQGHFGEVSFSVSQQEKPGSKFSSEGVVVPPHTPGQMVLFSEGSGTIRVEPAALNFGDSSYSVQHFIHQVFNTSVANLLNVPSTLVLLWEEMQIIMCLMDQLPWVGLLHSVLWFKELGRTSGFLFALYMCSGYGHCAGGEYMVETLHTPQQSCCLCGQPQPTHVWFQFL